MLEQEVALEVRGKAVQLWQGGDGQPLLYLHGAGLYIWMPVHNWLAGRRRVFLPVHPGFGESEGFDEIEDIEDLVFHTVDVMDELGLEQADVVGLSLGGWLAAELALRHPQRVKRLVLVDAGHAGGRRPAWQHLHGHAGQGARATLPRSGVEARNDAGARCRAAGA